MNDDTFSMLYEESESVFFYVSVLHKLHQLVHINHVTTACQKLDRAQWVFCCILWWTFFLELEVTLDQVQKGMENLWSYKEVKNVVKERREWKANVKWTCLGFYNTSYLPYQLKKQNIYEFKMLIFEIWKLSCQLLLLFLFFCPFCLTRTLISC